MDRLGIEAGRVFTPAAPVDRAEIFAGRTDQVRKVMDAISQKGQHAIIFGERGVGKTSLARVLHDFLKNFGESVLIPHITCDSGDDFTSLWRKVFDEIRLVRTQKSAGFVSEDSRVELPSLREELSENVSTGDVRRLLAPLAYNFIVVIILDEFDRLTKQKSRAMVADTIKMLSDHLDGVTLIPVGVADTVDELIKEHESISRNLFEIPMPRMSVLELTEILTKGFGKLRMNASQEVLTRITDLSRGLPHYTHLLGKHTARQAIDRQSLAVQIDDAERAIKQALDEAKQSTKSAYHRATRSQKKDALYRQVLLACALTETDGMGYFQPVDAREPMTLIMGKPYDSTNYHNHLVEFCDESRGRILERQGGERRWRYRFRNPLMEPFVLMRGVQDNMLPSGWSSAQSS